MSDDSETDWEALLSPDERAQMLQDIAQVSLAVGRHLFADSSHDDLDITAGSLLSRKSPVERLGFIARTLSALTQAVEQIACAPLTAPHARTHPVSPPERARRLNAQALLRSIRRGEAAHSVRETVTTWSTDIPENRVVRAFLRTLHRDAQAIATMAEAVGETEIGQTARHCSQRLQGLRTRLSGNEEAFPDDALSWVTPPTHRMLAHPAYTRIVGWMRRYRQDFGFDWDTPLFQLPARETWRLYEAWGLFQVLGALLALGFAPQAETTSLNHALFRVKQDRLLFRLATGEESVITLRSPTGRDIRLFYNRAYPARRRSLSRTMQPDIALEDGGGRTWILDPKFKAYAAPGDEGDDIDQMHAYRDAIVDGDGRKPVQRAWCLYVGQTDATPRTLIAYGPPAASVVGALCLRPGCPDGFTRLYRLIAAWGVSDREHPLSL